MAIVTLEQVKLHARVDHDDEDDLLERQIDAAQNMIERSLGYSIEAEFDEDVPPALGEAVCQLVAHWYANRELGDGGVAMTAIPYGVDEIIREFRNWSWDCD